MHALNDFGQKLSTRYTASCTHHEFRYAQRRIEKVTFPFQGRLSARLSARLEVAKRAVKRAAFCAHFSGGFHRISRREIPFSTLPTNYLSRTGGEVAFLRSTT